MSNLNDVGFCIGILLVIVGIVILLGGVIGKTPKVNLDKLPDNGINGYINEEGESVFKWTEIMPHHYIGFVYNYKSEVIDFYVDGEKVSGYKIKEEK